MRKLISLLSLCLVSSIALSAQQPVNVGTSANDHTGDAARTAYMKLNANDAELYGKFPVSVTNGGTGATTITGVLKGNGTSAITAASVSDLLGLFTGTCTVSVPLRGDGSCGSVPSSAVTGLAASATTDATNASNISSGTLPAGRLPALTGDCTTTIGTIATTCNKTGGVAFAASATTDATNASNISSGTLGAARLPNPSATTLGGVESFAAASHQWINSISTLGVPSATQPDASDITGLAASATTDTTNASNINSGTLPAGRLPNPSATTLGGIESLAAASHQWINTISTSGVPSTTQPAAADISGLAASATTDATNATNIASGTLAVARGGTGVGTLTAHGVLLGEGTSAVSAVAALAADNLLLGQGAADPAAVALTNCGDTTHALAYSTASHTFSCQNVTGSGGSPGGSTTQVQFNLTGAFAGDAGFTYVGSSTQAVTLGTATVGPTIQATTSSVAGRTFAITGSQGASASPGGPLNITAGAAGATSGTGGALSLTGGASATSGNNVGGAATLTAGTSNGNSTGGTASVVGGTPGTTGNGGTATLQGGPGGGTSGNGGAATVQGGSPTSGIGGAASVTGAAGVGANGGGAATLTGGAAGSSGSGGAVTVTGGAGGSGSGNGGAITLQAGNSTASTGGGIVINAALSGGANPGGTVNIHAGTGGSAGGAGGAVSITGGSGSGGSGSTGGGVTITSGVATGANNSGTLALTGAAPSATAGSTGGAVNISSGAGTSTGTGAQGNDISITAGNAGGSGANVGGGITLTAGNATGANNGGVVTLQGGNVGTGNTNGYENVAIKGGTSGVVLSPGTSANADTASIAIIGSASSVAANNGSDVLIRGGAPGGNAGTVGGNVWLRAGGGALANSIGNINMGGYNTGTGQPNQWYTFNMLTGAMGVNGATYGTSGDVLMSQGSASPPTWTSSITTVKTFPAVISGGTKFTTSGCSVSSTTGGGAAGIFTLGANSCTVIITINGATGATAPTGWSCQAHDRTAPTVLIGGESSSTTTTASIAIPAGAGATDVVSFSCTGY